MGKEFLLRDCTLRGRIKKKLILLGRINIRPFFFAAPEKGSFFCCSKSGQIFIGPIGKGLK
jgi:hypothetical protein